MKLQQDKRITFPERLQSVGGPFQPSGTKVRRGISNLLPVECMGTFLVNLLSVLRTANFQRYER